MTIEIVAAHSAGAADWAALRHALWPEDSIEEHAAEIEELLAAARPAELNLFAVRDAALAGFAEATIRHDHVNGCDTSPVAFLEGIYVTDAARGTGIARALVDAVVAWGRDRGCTELGSDAELDNADGRAFHLAAGFEETDRVVCFRRPI